jgi:hypothetical protein
LRNDPSDAKIGEIMDVVADRDGKIVVLIVGVGGFLGMGEKDVAVPFNAVQFKTKDNNKWYPVMNTTKDALKNAPGYKYDRIAMTWIPENAPATTGTPATITATGRPIGTISPIRGPPSLNIGRPSLSPRERAFDQWRCNQPGTTSLNRLTLTAAKRKPTSQ